MCEASQNRSFEARAFCSISTLTRIFAAVRGCWKCMHTSHNLGLSDHSMTPSVSLIGFSPCRSEGGVHNLNFKLVDTACCQVCISQFATSDNTNCSLEEEKSIADLARRWQDRYNAPGTE